MWEPETLRHPVTSLTGLHMLSLEKQFTTVVLAGVLLEGVMVSGCFSHGKKSGLFHGHAKKPNIFVPSRLSPAWNYSALCNTLTQLFWEPPKQLMFLFLSHRSREEQSPPEICRQHVFR